MELKEAYMTALKAEIQPLLDSGKITLLTTLEAFVEELAERFFAGLDKGAELSATPIDNMIVPPATKFLRAQLAPHIEKIDGK